MDAKESILAIDVVVLPPQPVMEKAKQLNGIFRQGIEGRSFALDDTHVPHITIFQLYARASDLENIFARVEKSMGNFPISKDLDMTGIAAGPVFAGLHLPSFAVESAELRAFHKDIANGMADYCVDTSGGPSYFYRDEKEEVNQASMDWVKNFGTNSSHAKYFPHITLGAAEAAAVERVISDPQHAQPFAFAADSVCVYQLGNNCTCRKLLWKKDLSSPSPLNSSE